MNIWDFFDRTLDRLPGWPSERQWVTTALVGTLWIMLQMTVDNPKLWDVKLFEILIQGFALTGFLSMVLAFHFAANKADDAKTESTSKMADAMKEQAITARVVSDNTSTANAVDAVAEAAENKAAEIKGEGA